MAIAPITAYFLSVLSSLGRYISHRFLLILNQIQISSTVKIHMNECISESDRVCELILSGSISLLVVKLWDLVIKKYMLDFRLAAQWSRRVCLSSPFSFVYFFNYSSDLFLTNYKN